MTAPIRPDPDPRKPPPRTFQDSMEAIAGSPTMGTWYTPVMTDPAQRMFLEAPLMTYGAAAGYNPILDMITSRSFSPEVLSHEYGHRLDYRINPPGLDFSFDSARKVNPAPRPDQYAATSRDEHFGEAFASAVRYMDHMKRVAGMYPQASREEMGRWADQNIADFEHQMPGTTVMVKYLLEHPLYAQHPLVSIYKANNPPRKIGVSEVEQRPDNTRVRTANAPDSRRPNQVASQGNPRQGNR